MAWDWAEQIVRIDLKSPCAVSFLYLIGPLVSRGRSRFLEGGEGDMRRANKKCLLSRVLQLDHRRYAPEYAESEFEYSTCAMYFKAKRDIDSYALEHTRP
jgi:hypothetical protein